MKPVVHYRGVAEVSHRKAFLYPVDHPDRVNVSNTKLVRTSTVIDRDLATGRIETEHTIYMPETAKEAA